MESKLQSKPTSPKCTISSKINAFLYYLCSVASGITHLNSFTCKGTPSQSSLSCLLGLQSSVIKMTVGHTLEYNIADKLRYENINVNEFFPSIVLFHLYLVIFIGSQCFDFSVVQCSIHLR